MGRTRSRLAASATDPGRERVNNEDRVLCEPELGIFAVIDGVGGESGGEVAAETALEVLRARLSRRTTDSQRLVREAIALANRQIYERTQRDAKLAGMSCVLTVAVVDGDKTTVGHVGDSRLYSLAPGTIRKVTPDHSPVGVREDAGDLSEAEAMRHPRRNEIFRDVGSAPHEPEEAGWIDVLEVPVDPEGALLLCSDGLSDMVPAREILDVVEKNAASPRAAVSALIERANAAGGKDNVSAVLVEGERFAEAVRRGRRACRPSPAVTGSGRLARLSARQGSAAQEASGLGSGAVASSQPAITARPGPRPVYGAAYARTGVAGRVKEALSSGSGRALWAVLAAILLLGGLAYFRRPLAGWMASLAGWTDGGDRSERRRDAPAVLVVGIGDAGLATIGEALSLARPGQRIEVAPGSYRERVVLRDGIDLVSRVARGAVLLPPAGGGNLPAVVAAGVHATRLTGFRVVPAAGAAWSVGVRLVNSAVEIDDVEVAGAAGAGVEIRGADRSTLRYCYIHHNGGPGIRVAGVAAPRLLSNLITGNGVRPGAPAAGVEVHAQAAPLLAGNRIEDNGGPGVLLPAPERAEEIFRWNTFGALSRDQAVRVAAPRPPGVSGAARPPAGAAHLPVSARRTGRPPAGVAPPPPARRRQP
ncbi:MAG TPA: protein phosphatase 2C domain-containing protein [Thermoanaerobaculia bacterium]|nr:protein phosphatase 2C domain-containing protein [Thermoanaerobaculia bacterium]